MELNVESKIYKFYELKEEINRTIDNATKLIAQYEALIDIIEKSGREKDLNENFLVGLRANIEELNKQVRVLTQRLVYIGYIIEVIEKKDEKAASWEQAISLAFEAIGLSETEVTSAEGEETKQEETTEEKVAQ